MPGAANVPPPEPTWLTDLYQIPLTDQGWPTEPSLGLGIAIHAAFWAVIVTITPHFTQKGTGGSERLSNFPGVTEEQQTESAPS